MGRGILLDYVAHCERYNKALDSWTRQEIHLSDIEEIIKYEKLQPRPGDILIIRSGFIKQYNESSEQQQIDGIQKQSDAIGIEATEQM